MLPENLKSILACPACKGGVEIVYNAQGLVCRHCGLTFPVKDRIPVMLTSEAFSTAARIEKK